MSTKATCQELLFVMFYSSKPVNLMTHQAYHTVVKYLNIWLKLAIFGQIYLKIVSIVVDTTLATTPLIFDSNCLKLPESELI